MRRVPVPVVRQRQSDASVLVAGERKAQRREAVDGNRTAAREGGRDCEHGRLDEDRGVQEDRG
jgi:hypothetical protein